jgi:hypothetical protein
MKQTTLQRHEAVLRYLKNKAELLDIAPTKEETYARDFLVQAIAIYEGKEPQELTWENDGVVFHMVET